MLLPFVAKVIPLAPSLQTVAFRLPLITGSAWMVKVIVSALPLHPEELTGVTLYITVNEPPVVLVNTSLTIALDGFPAPVVALPPEAVRPAATVILFMVFVDADTLVPLVARVIPLTASLHMVAF